MSDERQRDSDISAEEASHSDLIKNVKAKPVTTSAADAAKNTGNIAKASSSFAKNTAGKVASTAKGAASALSGGVMSIANVIGSALGLPMKAAMILMTVIMGGTITIFGFTIADIKQNDFIQQASEVYEDPKCDVMIPSYDTLLDGSEHMAEKRNSGNKYAATEVQRFRERNAKQLYKYLAAFDYTDEAIAGIISNAQAESDIDASKFSGDDMMDHELEEIDAENGGLTLADLADKYDIFIATHHVNWTDYTKSYLASNIDTIAGSQSRSYLSDARCKLSDGNYLPGIGMFQLPGERAASLFYFANCQIHPTDRDNDGNNDVVWELPYQIAYMYLENYSDVFTTHYTGSKKAPDTPDATSRYTYTTKYYGVNEWAREQFFANRELVTVKTETSSKYPNAWNIVFCLRAETGEYTVYEYYTLLVNEHIDMKKKTESCPTDTYNHYDDNVADLNGHKGGNSDVPDHDDIYTKHTVTVQPKLYSIAIDPEDTSIDETALINMMNTKNSYWMDGWFTGILYGNNIHIAGAKIVDEYGNTIKSNGSSGINASGEFVLSGSKLTLNGTEIQTIANNSQTSYKYFMKEASNSDANKWDITVTDKDGVSIRGLTGKTKTDGSTIVEPIEYIDTSFVDRVLIKEWRQGYGQGVGVDASKYNPELNSNIKIRQEMGEKDPDGDMDKDTIGYTWDGDAKKFQLKSSSYVAVSNQHWVCGQTYDSKLYKAVENAYSDGLDANGDGKADVQVPDGGAKTSSETSTDVASNVNNTSNSLEYRYVLYEEAVSQYKTARDKYIEALDKYYNYQWMTYVQDFASQLNTANSKRADLQNGYLRTRAYGTGAAFPTFDDLKHILANNHISLTSGGKCSYLAASVDGYTAASGSGYPRAFYDLEGVNGDIDVLGDRMVAVMNALPVWNSSGVSISSSLSSDLEFYKNKGKVALDSDTQSYVNKYSSNTHSKRNTYKVDMAKTQGDWTFTIDGTTVASSNSSSIKAKYEVLYSAVKNDNNWSNAQSNLVSTCNTAISKFATCSSYGGYTFDVNMTNVNATKSKYYITEASVIVLKNDADAKYKLIDKAYKAFWDYFDNTYKPAADSWATNEWNKYKNSYTNRKDYKPDAQAWDRTDDYTSERGFDTWWYLYSGTKISKEKFSDISSSSDPWNDSNDLHYKSSNAKHDKNEGNAYFYKGGPEQYIKYRHRYVFEWNKPFPGESDVTDYSSYASGPHIKQRGYEGLKICIKKDIMETMKGLDKTKDDLLETEDDDGRAKSDTNFQNGQDIAYENAAWFFYHYLGYSKTEYDRDSVVFKEHVNSARKWYNLMKVQDWRGEYEKLIEETYDGENPYKKLVMTYLPYNPYDEEEDSTTGLMSYKMIVEDKEFYKDKDGKGTTEAFTLISSAGKRNIPPEYNDGEASELNVWRANYDCGIGRFDNSSPSKAAVSMSYAFGTPTYAIDDSETVGKLTYKAIPADLTGEVDKKVAEYITDNKGEPRDRISDSTSASAKIYLMKRCTPAYVAIHNILKLNTDHYSDDGVAVATAIRASGYDDNFPTRFAEIKGYLCYKEWLRYFNTVGRGSGEEASTSPAMRTYSELNISDCDNSIFLSDTLNDAKWKCVGMIRNKGAVTGWNDWAKNAMNSVLFSTLRPGDILVSDNFVCMYVGYDARSKYIGNPDFMDTRYAICFAMSGDDDHFSTGMTCVAKSIKTGNIPTYNDNPIYDFKAGSYYADLADSTCQFIVFRPSGIDHDISPWYQLIKNTDLSSIHDGSTSTAVNFADGSASYLYAYGVNLIVNKMDDFEPPKHIDDAFDSNNIWGVGDKNGGSSGGGASVTE